jgi:hypothetical protein
MILKQLMLTVLVLLSISVFGQTASISGKVTDGTGVIPFANVALVGTSYGSVSDENGRFEIKNILNGKYQLQVSSVGFLSYKKDIDVTGKP